ncbi:hypothetical protein [Streptomyces tibetensis]|uniref:hypothetical protein n=1 Tax=Streptomyces tibetensis TaxID=2382123 RepID=UPI0033C64A36
MSEIAVTFQTTTDAYTARKSVYAAFALKLPSLPPCSEVVLDQKAMIYQKDALQVGTLNIPITDPKLSASWTPFPKGTAWVIMGALWFTDRNAVPWQRTDTKLGRRSPGDHAWAKLPGAPTGRLPGEMDGAIKGEPPIKPLKSCGTEN